MGLKLQMMSICIIVLTIALHVHGYFIRRPVLRTEINQSELGESAVDFHISSDRRDWKGSVDKCFDDGEQLANLDNEDEKEAFILALEHKNYIDGTRFWIYTCSHGDDIYCNEHCTDVTYIKSRGLSVSILSGADCKVKKRYICES